MLRNNMVLIYPPLKKASRFGWFHDLTSITDFTNCIGQRFGENQLDYSSLGLIGHNGLDISIPDGAEVFASHDGTVEFVGQDTSAGKGVIVKTQFYKTIYWHLMDFNVVLGQQEKQGDLLGHGD